MNSPPHSRFGADSLPPEAIERVMSVDYPLRRRVTARRLALGGGGVAAIATAVTLLINVFGPGVQNAFASWSPTPTVANSGQVSLAEASCAQAIQSTVQNIDAQQGASTYISTATAWQPVVVDVRGEFTLLTYQASSGTASNEGSCLSGGPSWSGGPQLSLNNEDGNSVSSAGNLQLSPGSSGVAPYSAQGSNYNGLSSAAPLANEISGPTSNWNSVSNDDVSIGQAGSGREFGHVRLK